jgi:hypothetical protein
LPQRVCGGIAPGAPIAKRVTTAPPSAAQELGRPSERARKRAMPRGISWKLL